MAKKNDNREYHDLKCSVCGFMIRPTEKNKTNTPDKMEIKKFCKRCNKTTVFKEKKQNRS